MPHNPIRNRILSHLAPADLGLMRGHLTRVGLELRQRIEAPNKPITHVMFVEQGIISVVATGPRRLTIEVGVIGFEGFTGVPVVLGGDRSPLDTYVQVAGEALSITVDAFRAVMLESPALVTVLNCHSQIFMTQIAQTALANGRAKLEERLARWLLMAQDRMESPELLLTHEFLALMLAVRRPGVTVALSLLQDQGLVKVLRGAIVIVDREGLETVADKFYGVPEAELKRLLG